MAEAIIFAPVLNPRMEIYRDIAQELIVDKELAFEKVFREYFKGLHAYAATIIRDEAQAEEIVQQVFVRLWEKDGLKNIRDSVASYLYRSVYNDSLNYLKHLKVRAAHQSYVQHRGDSDNHSEEQVSYKELQRRLDTAINELPEQCRTIFQLSRFEELKYKEIADRLGISVKTVENQMGKALRVLRQKLADYLPALLLWLILNI